MKNVEINFKFDHSKSNTQEALGLSKETIQAVSDKYNAADKSSMMISELIEKLNRDCSKEELLIIITGLKGVIKQILNKNQLN